MNEFELIELIKDRLGDTLHGPNVIVGSGDDAAVVQVPSEQDLVATTDVLLRDKHFPSHARADLVGYRAVAVNLSDLAAMGAKAAYVTVALTIEDADEDWIAAFAVGLRECCEEFGVKVIGGNLTRGSLSVAVTALGFVPRGKQLTRSGACIGDDVWLTGCVGATAKALSNIADPMHDAIDEMRARREDDARCRYFLPQPRLALGRELVGVATAAIDVSDGLLSELRHLMRASGCGVCVDLREVSVWPGVERSVAVGADDSYELLFCAPRSRALDVEKLARTTSTRLSKIGRITERRDLIATQTDASVETIQGFSHF